MERIDRKFNIYSDTISVFYVILNIEINSELIIYFLKTEQPTVNWREENNW